jgi:hypothetical protein
MPSPMTNLPHLQATLSDLHATQPLTPTPYEAALLTTITVLTEQLLLVQNQMQHQEQVIEQLLTLVPQPRPPHPSRARNTSPQPSVPKTPRSMDYWIAHVPEYGDSLTSEELATFLAKPRVRPEDIPIAPIEDKRRRRYSSAPWDWQAILNRHVLLLLILCGLVMSLIFWMWLRTRL